MGDCLQFSRLALFARTEFLGQGWLWAFQRLRGFTYYLFAFLELVSLSAENRYRIMSGCFNELLLTELDSDLVGVYQLYREVANFINLDKSVQSQVFG
jgi:hypothetical protein